MILFSQFYYVADAVHLAEISALRSLAFECCGSRLCQCSDCLRSESFS